MNPATDRDWLRRHPALGAALIGLLFGALFALFIAAVDTHGFRFAAIAGVGIGLLLLAPYVWWKLRKD